VQDSIVLHFSLPRGYPAQQNPVVTFSAPNLSKAEHQALQAKLNAILSSLSSTDERILEIIESFNLSIPTATQESFTQVLFPQPTTSHEPNIVVLIWFHHLLSLTKRKAILALQSVRGISKPGYPGILVLQNHKPVLNDAITELKGMKWQAMQVRAEIECDEKSLEDGVHEVESIAEVVERMERLGLGEWCLSALRMK
jgi:RWD domain